MLHTLYQFVRRLVVIITRLLIGFRLPYGPERFSRTPRIGGCLSPQHANYPEPGPPSPTRSRRGLR